MLQSGNLLNSLYKAMRAEEKQGFINTGAIGGFSDYWLDALSWLAQIVSRDKLERMKYLAQEYKAVSPYKRRGIWLELYAILGDVDTVMHSDAQTKVDMHGLLGHPQQPDEKTAIAQQLAQDTAILQKTNPSPDLQYIKGVGPQRAKQFENLGIFTVEDLLRYFPRKYEVRQKRCIIDLQDGEYVTVEGTVTGSHVTNGRIKVVRLNIEQDGRYIHAVWFNQIYIPKQYPEGMVVSVTGKVQWQKRIPEILVSEISKGAGDGKSESIIPIYSETNRLNSKAIREIVKAALPQTDKLFEEFLPADFGLMPRSKAIREMHFPSATDTQRKARERLVIEEILLLQLALAMLRAPGTQKTGCVINQGNHLVNAFIASLPFKLTGAQQRVIKEIFKDMEKNDKTMTRLLQGDVGSGKTAVAMCALLQAVGSGFQGAMMAPTEVLAGQHYQSIKEAFEPLGIRVVYLIGNQTRSEREQILDQIRSGQAQVVVGTQALIQETVQFNSLGLVITDEQHRFGVRQRTLLQDKGGNPHVLVMTATPIPRTLALTLYGDLQLSVLDELPNGRKPVITKKISDRSRGSMEKFLHQQILTGRQVYIVCPLVAETEKSDLVSATQKAEEMKKVFADYRVALLHGRMKGQEKEQIMQSFRQGDIDILVTTTVVEVGVNVPNASVMVVERAERFGLAQLHQLRGRVGRGNEQSYCILVSNTHDSARLNILCETEDGFRIAEEDLKIRGPGELLGLRQHGIPELKLTDLTSDGRLVELAYQLLQNVLKEPVKYDRVHKEANRLYPKEKIGLN
ncbi:ATP-dependent DNA helicase RecG [Dehalobacter sp. DCM]|uniref:ATP-dependent DNA helicase RecG n=1 Tax=Dehalobacter sp. DCM TaxID=2907827 RepID=UPI003081FD2C|nr:ATP-dependent DNA helicase RecG [Dehalobacter sp. DCM]